MPAIVIATFSSDTTRRLLEIAFALAAIGGVSLLAAGITGRHRELLSVGGVLVAATGVLAVIATHWGVTPWTR